MKQHLLTNGSRDCKTLLQSGFSLVELAVVLVILGLLAGGITAGSALIKGAQLRAIASEVENFNSSLSAFKLQFQKYPGDLNNAASFWAAASCPGIPAGGMNGNGNNKIEFLVAAGAIESYTAWCHLSLAGLNTGTYTGAPVALATAPTLGTMVPTAKIENAGYVINWGGFGMGTTNNLILSGPVTNMATAPSGVIAPRDAANIDGKKDDGVANTGSIRGIQGAGAAANTCVLATGAYALLLSGLDCAMAFSMN